MIGQTISHYKITEKLGEGGMGVVYKAEDTRLERTVALKFLKEEALDNKEAKQRFLREARAAASLDHSNVCAVHDIDEEDGRTFLAMSFVQGESIRQKVSNRPLPLDEALDYAIQAAQGLEAAHKRGVVHRDVKSANLMVTEDGQVKVMDFGLAQLADQSRLTKTATFLGTPAYMSPEQTQRKETDARTDIWSLGVVLYEMVSGRLPFQGENEHGVLYAIVNCEPEPLTAQRFGLPVELDRIVGKAMAKNPGERYQHADDLRVDLNRLKRELATDQAAQHVKSTAPRSKVDRYLRRNGTLIGVFLVFVFLMAFFWASPPTREPKTPSETAEWIQITDFADSVTWPALSSDGRMLAFIRGASTFFGPGEIFMKALPDGQAVQLTQDGIPKMSPAFSPDGSRIAYTTVRNNFAWDTWEVPVFGGSARPWLENASGLVWIDDRRLLYSEIKSGFHMAIVTATESGTDHRDVYVPPNSETGMAHLSYLSPDEEWVLLVEMVDVEFTPCRLVPFGGGPDVRTVGPEGKCTSAAWSPDGAWMYFTANIGEGFHLWRQRFPDGALEQITSGPTEEEGVAVSPDGRSLITSVGIKQSSVWVRDPDGERQVSLEGNASITPELHLHEGRFGPAMASLPRAFSSDGSRLYYLGEGGLWSADLGSASKERLLPDFEITAFDVAADGKRVAFVSHSPDGGPTLWMGSLERPVPPRQLPTAAADSPHFGPHGELYFRLIQDDTSYVYKWTESGGLEKAINEPTSALQTVSPDGEWLIVRQPAPGREEDNQLTAVPVRGGAAVPICNICLIDWTADQKALYVTSDFYRPGGPIVYVVQLESSDALPDLPPGGIRSDEDILAMGGVPLDRRGFVHAGPVPSIYAFTRESIQRNLYRVPLSE